MKTYKLDYAGNAEHEFTGRKADAIRAATEFLAAACKRSGVFVWRVGDAVGFRLATSIGADGKTRVELRK